MGFDRLYRHLVLRKGAAHSMSTGLLDIDERTNLTANNKFELLLFRLGEASDGTQ